MPTVPRYQAPQVASQGLPTPQFSTASPQVSPDAFGAGIGRGLGAVAEVLRQEEEKANTVQVMSAEKKLYEREFQILRAPKTGALAKLGKDAFDLPDTVPADYDKAVAEIAKDLANDRQRLAFEKLANARRESVLNKVTDHVSTQLNAYAKSESQAFIDSAVNTAALNYADPARLSTEIDKASRAVLAQAKITGEPDEATQVRLAGVRSTIHNNVVVRALQDQKLDYADQYLKDHAQDMNVADLVKVTGLVNTAKKNQLAVSAAGEVMKSALPQLQPNDMDRLWAITAGTESNGQDFGKDGQPVTSPKGAKYAMQVMPDTAKNPGFGIRPAADDSPGEYNRVGREYLGAMLKEFGGDLAKTWAAYNAGPGAVEAAVTKAEKMAKLAANDPAVQARPWLDYMPAETRDYVAKNLKKYDGNFTVAAPTLLDLKAQVAERLKGETSEVIEAAKAKVEANYNDWQADRRQREDNLLTSIQNQVDAGQIKSLADLDPQTLQSLGDKRQAARAYIESAGKRSDKMLELSPVATTFYYELYTDPVKLKSQSVADIMKLAPELGQARVNKLLQQRSDYINRPEKELAANVDNDQWKDLATKFGFNLSNDRHKQELLHIRERTEQAIATIQADQKKSLTREEKGKIISNMMVEFPAVKYQTTGLFDSGFLAGSGTQAKRGYAVESPENIVIPAKARAEIEKTAKARGITLSTPAQWREAYAAYLKAERGL